MTGGTLSLGTAAAPLAQNGLTIKAGASLVLNASGNGDTVFGGNAGDTIMASGDGAHIEVGSGANVVTADGASDIIVVGLLTSGTISKATVIHAGGAGNTIAFATQATALAVGSTIEGTSIVFAGGASEVDGGSPSVGIGANDTIQFGNITGGSETVVLTGTVTGATSAGKVALTTLSNVGANDILVFNNTSTETTSGLTFAVSEVNITAAANLAAAYNLAASAMSTLPGQTAVLDWFRWGSDSYIVEAVNASPSAASHAGLGTGDVVVHVSGLSDLSTLSGIAFNTATHSLVF